MSASNSLPSPDGASLPLPAYLQPADVRRRVRLQRLPQGNFNLVFEADGRAGYPVIYANVPLGAATALSTMSALGLLCERVDRDGLP